MPAKKKDEFDPLANPGRHRQQAAKELEVREDMDSFPKPKLPLYARLDGKAIVELTRFGQLMLARCEDDSMYLMQGNGTWTEFMFEIVGRS